MKAYYLQEKSSKAFCLFGKKELRTPHIFRARCYLHLSLLSTAASCSSCHLLYNSSVSGLQTGEPSRFLAQLELLPQAQHRIEHQVLHNSSKLKQPTTQEFPKKLVGWYNAYQHGPKRVFRLQH